MVKIVSFISIKNIAKESANLIMSVPYLKSLPCFPSFLRPAGFLQASWLPPLWIPAFFPSDP
jgi:hypothetical protein